MSVIVLVGYPGSGKSTYCKKYPEYVRINQDEMGDRYKCLEAFRKALKNKQNIIVDRCNINKGQRLIWLMEAKKYGVNEIKVVYLKTGSETCLKRIDERKNHPTIKDNDLEKNKKIVDNFVKNFEMPEIEEGFNEVLVIYNE